MPCRIVAVLLSVTTSTVSEAMRAWLMPDVVSNQREECRLDPNVDVVLENLAKVGVYYEFVCSPLELISLDRTSEFRRRPGPHFKRSQLREP